MKIKFPSQKLKRQKPKKKAFSPHKGIQPTKRHYAHIWHKADIKHKIKHMKPSRHNQRETPNLHQQREAPRLQMDKPPITTMKNQTPLGQQTKPNIPQNIAHPRFTNRYGITPTNTSKRQQPAKKNKTTHSTAKGKRTKNLEGGGASTRGRALHTF